MVVSPVGGRVPPTRGVLHSSLAINGTRRDLEAEEVSAYLTKLRSLVPDMPRKRKLSKLEVIQRVIEYICDLQTTLEETNIHGDPGMVKTAGRQPLQPLLNAATAISPAAVAERWPTIGSMNSSDEDGCDVWGGLHILDNSFRGLRPKSCPPSGSRTPVHAFSSNSKEIWKTINFKRLPREDCKYCIYAYAIYINSLHSSHDLVEIDTTVPLKPHCTPLFPSPPSVIIETFFLLSLDEK